MNEKKLEEPESMEPEHQLPKKTPPDHQLAKPKNMMGYLVAAGLFFLALGFLAFYLVGKSSIPKTPIYMWTILGVAGVILILAIVFVALTKKGKIKQQEPDYRTFFILGIAWIPLGIVMDNFIFTAMGAVFMIIALANRSKWKNQPKWKDLPPAQKKLKITLLVVLGLMVLLGLAAFYLVG